MGHVKEVDGQWTFITPVSFLVLTAATNYEFRIDRVLLVHKNKLPRIRKRLGIFQPISRIKQAPFPKPFFEKSNTYAVVRHSGKPQEIKNKCYRLVKDELALLALSQLGYNKRRLSGHLSLQGEYEAPSFHHLFVSNTNEMQIEESQITGSAHDLVIDGLWKNYQKEFFFFKLLKIITSKDKVSPAWRDDLRRAAILIGQSINSNDIAMSFLWNMIAIELLLTKQGEKIKDTLPRRIEAFIGWVGFWELDNFEARIREVYQKRNLFVHNGIRDAITKKDLLFTDDLLLNLLTNITTYISVFKSKDAIIDFSEKVEAEHLLGIKSGVRPKKLVYVSRKYNSKDYDEI